MKRFGKVIGMLLAVVMALSIVPQISFAEEGAEVDDVLFSAVTLRYKEDMPDEELLSGTGETAGVFVYGNFLLVPINYKGECPGIEEEDRSCIAVYRLGGNSPVYLGKWNKADLGIPIRNKTNEDIIKGMTINDDYIALVVHTERADKNTQREVGLFLYENPLRGGSFRSEINRIRLENEDSVYGCNIISSKHGVPNTNYREGFTLHINNGCLISFFDVHSAGGGDSITVTDLETGENLMLDEKALFTVDDVVIETLDDVVFEGNKAYILGSTNKKDGTVITNGSNSFYARELVLYTVDITNPKNPSVLSYVIFDSDYPYVANYTIDGTKIGTNNPKQDRALSIQDGYAYVTGRGANMDARFKDKNTHIIVLKQNGNDFEWVSEIPLRTGELGGKVNYHGRGLGEVMAVGDILIGTSGDAAQQNQKAVYLKLNEDKTAVVSAKVTEKMTPRSSTMAVKGCKYKGNTLIFGGLNSGYNKKTTDDTNAAYFFVVDVMSTNGEWDITNGGQVNRIKNMTAGFRDDYLKKGNNEIYVKGVAPESGVSFKMLTALYENEVVASVNVSEKYTFAGNEQIDITDNLDLTQYSDLYGLSARVFLWEDVSTPIPVAYAISPQMVGFEFTLEEKATTSAGVYDKNDRLIKTLWSVVEYEAGKHTAGWDGTDDYGNIVREGSYKVKIASNNVVYEKLIPVIGNTSDCSRWDSFISSYNSLFDMAYDANTKRIYYCSDHVEGGDGLRYLNAGDLSRNGGLLKSGNKTATHTATDGEVVYWGAAELNMATGTGKYAGDVRSFVYATNMLGNVYEFTDKNAWQPVSSKWNEALWKADKVTPNTLFPYSINYVLRKGAAYDETTADLSKGAEFVFEKAESGNNYNRIGGLEVQQDGNYLMTAYRDYNKVFVNDKKAGTRISTLDITEPSAMAMSTADDSCIYIAYRTENGKFNIGRFGISSNGTLTKQSDPITGLDTVIAMAVNPTNSKIAVVEGGDTEKLSIWTVPTEAGASTKLMSYGCGESYLTDPTVKDDKFMFDDKPFMYKEPYEHSFAEFDSENTLFIGDSGNGRVYKMDISGGSPQIVDRIEFQSSSYNAWCVENDPEHIFSNAREYVVDYEALEEYVEGRENQYDYEGFENTWKLEKNYLLYIAEYLPDFKGGNRGQFYRATKLSNGYVYFGMNMSNGRMMYKQAPSGAITPTGINLDKTDLHADGSLWRKEKTDSREIYYSRALSGFDSENNPVYEQEVKRAEIDFTGQETVLKSSYDLINITDSGKLVWLAAAGPLDREEEASMAGKTEDVYDNPTGKARMHLAAVDLNKDTTEIAWAAAPDTLRRNDNFYPNDGYFNIGNQVKYTTTDTMTYKTNYDLSIEK